MKKLLLLMAVVSLVAMPAAAQFQQLVEVQVKPGHEVAYEEYLKKIGEAADKTGSPMSWSTFSVAVGKSGSTYRVALPFEKWGERDGWLGVREVLVKAYGENEGTKIYTAGGAHVANISSRIWEVIEDGTANPQTGTNVSAFYDVRIAYVKSDMVAEYRGLLRRLKSAYENADSKPSVTRWVLRFGDGPRRTFRRTQPFDSWSERDS